ncbi:MAG: hypothetical protein JJ863_13740 [Deltaproteobacteria bacterium]|nr:hypothetical protein [Deltaproteobacteria bacterium]
MTGLIAGRGDRVDGPSNMARYAPLFVLLGLVACSDDDGSGTDDLSDMEMPVDAASDAGRDSGPPLPACSAAADEGWEVCADDGDRCTVAFEDGEGCAAVCAAIGRTCVDALDTPGIGCEHNGTSLGCAPTGHGSDLCICDRVATDMGVPDGGVDDAIELTSRKAFPSAAGLGVEDIEGGRGGTIFFVTDLANRNEGSYDEATDTHSGTFRYALEHPDPGVIVFRTAGVASVGSGSSYTFTQDAARKTILGATAPAPGVVFYGGAFTLRGGRWIIRGMTFLGGSDVVAGATDAFSGNGATHVALADNTFGWGGDEAYTVRRFERLLAQRNVAFEGHPDHSVGSIFAADTDNAGARLLSAHDNAYVHLSHRFPNTQGLETDRFEVINQFAYNWNRRTESHKFQARHNDIANYYRSGPRTSSMPRKAWNAHQENDSPLWNPPPQYYTAGNIMTGFFEDPDADNRVLWSHHISSAGYVAGEALPATFFVATPHPLGVDIEPRTAQRAYEYNVVGGHVGARHVVDADGVRQRYVLPLTQGYLDDAIAGTDDAYLRDETEFVMPSLPAADAPYEDSDRDGMADAWEREHGLVVGERDHEEVRDVWTLDGATFRNTAGYTNLEIFADWAHGGFVVLRDRAMED